MRSVSSFALFPEAGLLDNDSFYNLRVDLAGPSPGKDPHLHSRCAISADYQMVVQGAAVPTKYHSNFFSL